MSNIGLCGVSCLAARKRKGEGPAGELKRLPAEKGV